MMKRLAHIILILLAAVVAHTAVAQVTDSIATDTVAPKATINHRFITPVKQNTNTVLQPGKDIDEKVLEVFLSGDTARAKAEAAKDSLRKVYTHYPVLTDVTVGVNFIDMVLAAAGQKHMNADLSLTLNMWNRLQPVLELGVGYANNTPEDMNYTYKGQLSPFARVGVNYNFLFKSKPEFQALVGARVGGTMFKYEITDIQYHNGYWGESETTSIPQQSSSALWYELVGGLKVKIVKNFSLGWFIRFHNLISEKKNDVAQAWFIPGYGTRNGSLAFSFSAYYTLPLYKKKIQDGGSIATQDEKK